MVIPIENIYYLLCYAWNNLDEKDRVDVTAEDCSEILDLLSKVVINGTRILLKRGIDKSYITSKIELAGIKGKLELAETVKKVIHLKQHTWCTVDEFSADILTNRILISTLYLLLKIKNIDQGLKEEIKHLLWVLTGIQPIELSSRIFNQVKLHRNNRFYGFLLSVCRLIYENSLPTEKPGEYRFMDFTRDEKKMSMLFEAFIRNFYRKHLHGWDVGRSNIMWRFNTIEDRNMDFLPRMQTDITMECMEEKIIIDTKYYQETMMTNYDKRKIHSNNLYQLFSYLLNQRSTDVKTLKTKGILLYPTIENEYDLSYKFEDHPIQIKTLNLNQHWKLIEKRLMGLVFN